MFLLRTWWTCCLLLLPAIWLSAGCRQQNRSVPAPTKSQSSATSTAPQIRRFSVAQIGETLGGYLPPVDGGKLRIAPPAGWRVRPRSSKYLVRFVFDPTRRSPLPQITVTVEPASFDQPYDLDADTLLEFEDLVEEQMPPTERKSMLEPIKPMILGDVPCLRYVIGKTFERGGKRIRGECQIVKTLHAGRIYTVALDVYRGTLIANKNYAYVVVAGMTFSTPEDSATEEQPATDKPNEGQDKADKKS